MRTDQPGDNLPPLTVDDLVDLLEGIDLRAEVRIAFLDTRPTQMRVAGIRTNFATKPPDSWSPARVVWIVAGEDMGEIPIVPPSMSDGDLE